MMDYNARTKTEFKEQLQLVEREARNLQSALLSRNSDLIFEAVTRQRVALDEIERYIEQHNPLKTITPGEKKTVIQPMMNRIRRMLARNEKMSRVLLGVINKTLSNLAIGTKNTANVYNGYGKVSNMASPILVNAQG